MFQSPGHAFKNVNQAEHSISISSTNNYNTLTPPKLKKKKSLLLQPVTTHSPLFTSFPEVGVPRTPKLRSPWWEPRAIKGPFLPSLVQVGTELCMLRLLKGLLPTQVLPSRFTQLHLFPKLLRPYTVKCAINSEAEFCLW